MFFPEEKLAVKVGIFYDVRVGDGDFSCLLCTDVEDCEIF